MRPPELRFGPWRPRWSDWTGLGVILDGLVHDQPEVAAPADYVDLVLLTPDHRAAFLALIDDAGLVVCRNVGGADATHAEVRGRSSRGRLSPSELYHHDGCAGPTKPRVVEIRCPYQPVPRAIATAIAPFHTTVHAMLEVLSPELRGADPEVVAWHAALAADGALPLDAYDRAQGAINRITRVAMSAEATRAYFRAVDARAGAYREPWTMGESRFIANSNPGRTMQHRRAYLEPPGPPNGHLIKRWPDGPAMHE
ncbi:MAG: hypothetical protein IPL61_28955 [Myxococcales bacterium]|nr:hypothetical protein [Myxococcales bacterium]